MKKGTYVYVSLPREIMGNDLTEFWNHLASKIHQEYPDDCITSNYTGDGCLEDAKKVILIYEFRDFKSSRYDLRRCKELGIDFAYFNEYYSMANVDL